MPGLAAGVGRDPVTKSDRDQRLVDFFNENAAAELRSVLRQFLVDPVGMPDGAVYELMDQLRVSPPVRLCSAVGLFMRLTGFGFAI